MKEAPTEAHFPSTCPVPCWQPQLAADLPAPDMLECAVSARPWLIPATVGGLWALGPLATLRAQLEPRPESGWHILASFLED